MCPPGKVIKGFSTGSTTYGLPICINPVSEDGSSSSFTGGLVGTPNYVAKYNSTGTGIVNSQIFDNGSFVGVGTNNPTTRLHILGGIRIEDGNQ